MKKLILSAVLLSVFTVNKAQEKDIEEVIVTGKVMNLPYKKSNANITIISKSQIESVAAQSVEEVLACLLYTSRCV